MNFYEFFLIVLYFINVKQFYTILSLSSNNFITMSTTNQHKVRAVSARPPLGRPVSGKYRKMHQKT